MGIIPSKRKKKRVNQTIKRPTVETNQEPEGWKNMGFKIVKEMMGPELFEKMMVEADEPPPEAGPFSASQLALYVKKYQAGFLLKTLLTQQTRGVGATGVVTVLNNPLLPAHDFFSAERVFPARLLHCNLIKVDDAELDVRLAALKFADSDFESPFDLLLHTGEEAAYWSLYSLDKMLSALYGETETFATYCLEDPWHFYLTIAAFRRAPESFTDQRYYSWMAFEYKARDGVPRYAKFRLVPADDREETGLMTEEEQRKPWETFRWEGDRRPKSYLTADFEERMSEGGVQYKLQIQLHEKQPDDSHLVLHAARVWDQATHPWLDLAEVRLTSLLPEDVTKGTRCSLENIPCGSLSLPSAKTIYDYNSMAYLKSKLQSRPKKQSFSLRKTSKSEGDMSIYCISVFTGDRKHAGTNADVTLTITGSRGRTRPLLMDKWLHDDFKAGQDDTYILAAEDVGDLLMIKLHNDQGGLYSDWFVEKIMITCSQNPQKLYEFPCFRWVQSESIFFTGKALLVTDEQHEVIRSQRRLEIQQRQELFQWGEDPLNHGLPGYVKSEHWKKLPKDVQFTEEAVDDLHTARNKALVNLGLIKLLNIFDSWEDFDDYRKAFVSFVGDVPMAADHWQDDCFYGAQFLNGCNPETIKRCTELPYNFPVTQQLVGNLLDVDDTLEKAMKDGRVYMVDFSILDGILSYGFLDENLETRYTCAAMGLFYVKGTGDMVPIAIQLHQGPDVTNPLWTPNDSELDWTYAKMWLRNADMQWHQTIAHLLRTHFFMEPLALASWRQLPSLHPLWKLLVPHLKGVMAINTLGRARLIAAGGVVDQTLSIGGGGHIDLMKKYYKNMKWSSYDLPNVLKERGVDDPDKLPGFHYRDDALRLWQAIKNFVTRIVSIYYPLDEVIQKDTELQAWILDIHDNGYTVREGETDHGFPSSIASAEQLAHILTIVIFTCSCQHAAVNFSQMDVLGFPPNSPGLMRQPPPKEKGTVTMKDIMKTLPTKHQAGVAIATVNDLTRISPDERFLGDYPDSSFTDMAAREAILRFQGKLQRISASIKKRNEKLKFPYTYLLPEKIPNSIAI
nr:allene oxide synthase-lipoxygenase protein-like [Pocillopora verrucosa]XP_058954728.1 allene oxide synthase-lipoxygenase protein-like [Pocillopora verrucosa]